MIVENKTYTYICDRCGKELNVEEKIIPFDIKLFHKKERQDNGMAYSVGFWKFYDTISFHYTSNKSTDPQDECLCLDCLIDMAAHVNMVLREARAKGSFSKIIAEENKAENEGEIKLEPLNDEIRWAKQDGNKFEGLRKEVKESQLGIRDGFMIR